MTTTLDRTDEQVAVQAQKGDMASFQALVERYEQKMGRYAKRFLFASDDAEDVLQDVFVKVYVNIRSFDSKRRFSPWIYRIAHNEFINALKKKNKEKNTFALGDSEETFPQLIAKESADEKTSRREIKEILEGSLRKLGPKYREPIILYYLKDMNYREIARELDIPVSTVGVRLQRGKYFLRKCIEEGGE